VPFPDTTPSEWLALMAGLSAAFDAPPPELRASDG